MLNPSKDPSPDCFFIIGRYLHRGNLTQIWLNAIVAAVIIIIVNLALAVVANRHELGKVE